MNGTKSVSSRVLVALWAVIAAVLIAGAAMLFAPPQGYAEPTLTTKAYQEVVTYVHSGGTKRVIESDNNTYVVYCTQASRSPSSTVGTDADKREKYFWNAAINEGDVGAAYANPLVYLLYLNEQDRSPGDYQFTVDDWNIDPVGGQNPVNADLDTSGNYALGLKHLILKTLYYGYPYNKGDGTYSEAETQSAIYWCIYAGKNGGSDISSYYNNLVKEVLSNNAFEDQFPSWWDLSMYIYLPTNEARKAGMTQQALIRATYEIGPYVSNTTVNANGKTPTDAVEDPDGNITEEEKPAEVEIEKGDSVTVKDTVTLNGLTAGVKYTVEWEVLKTDKSSVKKGTKDVTASGTSEAVEIDMGALTNLKGDYTIKTILKDADGNKLSEHNGNLDITKETFKVTVKGEEEESDEPSIKTSAKGTSDQTIKAEAGQTITDTVTYSNLTVGSIYQLQGYLMDKSTGEELSQSKAQWTYQINSGKFTAESASGTQDVTFNINAQNLKEGDQIVVFEYLHEMNDDGSTKTENVATHEEIGDTAQTITVSSTGDDSAGDLATTVMVGGAVADEGEILHLDDASYVAVVDTIKYSDLTAGATYKVTGQLMKFPGESEVVSVEEEFTADSSGSGEWKLNFGMQALAADSYYVVYESAVNTADSSDKAEHKDKTDTAQAVVIETIDETWEILKNDPTFAPAYELSMATTVSINGKAASESAPRSLTVADAAKVNTVTDTIAYKGFGDDDTYSITGALIDVANQTAPIATASKNVEADASGSGTWDLEFKFDTGKLEAGHKYVVFEYAYDSEGNLVASHADTNDNAQTIVVTAKATSASKSTAKTADTTSSIAFAAMCAALLAAGVGVTARRRMEK